MRLLYARFCCVFTGFEDAVRHRSGDQFGTPSARILLGFRCFASMPHGRVHRPCPPTILYYLFRYPPCAYIYMSMLLLCFCGFRRCCTAPPLGINLARLGLECCWGSAVSQACLTDAFIGYGYVRLYAPICSSISAMMRLSADPLAKLEGRRVGRTMPKHDLLVSRES